MAGLLKPQVMVPPPAALSGRSTCARPAFQTLMPARSTHALTWSWVPIFCDEVVGYDYHAPFPWIVHASGYHYANLKIRRKGQPERFDTLWSVPGEFRYKLSSGQEAELIDRPPSYEAD